MNDQKNKAKRFGEHSLVYAHPSGWEKVLTVYHRDEIRAGWGGVWDLFIATLLKNPVDLYTKSYEISFWIKYNKGRIEEVNVDVADLQLRKAPEEE